MLHPLARTLLLAAAVALASDSSLAQGRFFWSQSLDGPGAKDDQALDVAISPQGQVFVAAASWGAVDQDALVVSYDSRGSQLWQSRIDLGGTEYAGQIAHDPITGDVFVAGASAVTGTSGTWMVARLDAVTGTVRWRNDYLGPQGLGGNVISMALDANGGVVVGGFSGTPFVHDALVARFDASGTLSWAKLLPGPVPSISACSWIVPDPSGDVIVRTAHALGGTQWTLHRLSAAGASIWSKPIGATDNGVLGPFLDASSSLAYGINVSGIGTRRIVKLDGAGNALWSVDSATLFGSNSQILGVAMDPAGEVVTIGSNAVLARLDAAGATRWVRGLPPVAWFELGSIPSGLRLDVQGDSVVRLRGHVPGTALDFDAVARWDVAGNFLWSQAVRSFEPDVEVQTLGMELAPQGSAVIAGYSQPSGAPHKDLFVAAVRKSSQLGCFGDGSSGACPCNNNVPPGTASGCAKANGAVGARLDDQGISSLGSDSLRFFASGLPSTGIALLLQGHPAAQPIPFQDGRMCIGGRITRIYTAALTSPLLDLAPVGGQRVHVRSAAAGDVIQLGTSRAYQLFYRGPNSACQPGNGNLTNSVLVDWTP